MSDDNVPGVEIRVENVVNDGDLTMEKVRWLFIST